MQHVVCKSDGQARSVAEVSAYNALQLASASLLPDTGERRLSAIINIIAVWTTIIARMMARVDSANKAVEAQKEVLEKKKKYRDSLQDQLDAPKRTKI